MAVQFPGADYLKKLAKAGFEAENKQRQKDHLPNRFIHFPDWRDEFGRLVKD